MGDMSGEILTASNPVLTCGGKPVRVYFHQRAWRVFSRWGRGEEARQRRAEGKQDGSSPKYASNHILMN